MKSARKILLDAAKKVDKYELGCYSCTAIWEAARSGQMRNTTKTLEHYRSLFHPYRGPRFIGEVLASYWDKPLSFVCCMEY